MPTGFRLLPTGRNDTGRRLDRIARKVLPHLSLGRIFRAIRTGEIVVDGRRVPPDHRFVQGQRLEVAERLFSVSDTVAPASSGGGPSRDETKPMATSPESRIVFRSDDLLVINKARGELVHGDRGLDEWVREAFAPRALDGVSFVPGPVNRLDRNSTGLVIFALTLDGARALSECFRNHEVVKSYAAVFRGTLSGTVNWRQPISRDGEDRVSRVDERGKRADTTATALSCANGMTLATVTIGSGRTHQIRAHASANGYPLAGDRKYGGGALGGGHILHAGCIVLARPVAGLSRVWAPLPEGAEQRLTPLFGAGAIQEIYDRWRA